MESTRIAAADFKARCLSLLDEVAATGQPLIVTKHGRPVAKVVPLPPTQSLFGAMAGSVLASEDLLKPIDDVWEADR